MSELFPHTITLYIKYTAGLGNWQGGLPPTPSIKHDRVIIHNASWEDDVHRDSDNTGKPFINKTNSVTIPLNEMEVEGNKRYVNPNEYASLRVDDENIWTLQITDIIVFGECDKEITASYTITKLRDEYKSMEIKAVADTTEQDTLPNWEISGV